ncbi:MAG: sugar-binding transcriptional regulator [Oscillospiraceae bacterium]|nr:sugar-binding transcriptional regulator [Oscillospiraceae bacterium]
MEITKSKADYEQILMVKTAWYYYVENYTQQSISELLGISRAKVISLLEKARQTGVIQFNIRQDSDHRMKLEQDLIKRYGLNDVFTIPGGDTLQNLRESMAQAAAMYISKRCGENAFINIGYGQTTSLVLNHLASMVEKPINVVSLTGGVNFYLPNAYPGAFNARLYLIPSPLSIPDKAAHDCICKLPSLEEISRLIPLASMSVIGIGGMVNDATIVKNGVFSENDFVYLRMQGAVGDVLSRFVDKEGKPIDTPMLGHLVGTSLEELKALKNVIGVAGGPDKVDAIRAVLRGGYLDVLITDEDTAEALLNE